jgi:hypothetical protein
VKEYVEKGLIRIKSKNNSYFDSKMLSKKECNKMIKNFKNDIDQGKKFLELSLISGADLLIMIHDLEHIVYIPEKIINKEKKVEENKG